LRAADTKVGGEKGGSKKYDGSRYAYVMKQEQLGQIQEVAGWQRRRRGEMALADGKKRGQEIGICKKLLLETRKNFPNPQKGGCEQSKPPTEIWAGDNFLAGDGGSQGGWRRAQGGLVALRFNSYLGEDRTQAYGQKRELRSSIQREGKSPLHFLG